MKLSKGKFEYLLGKYGSSLLASGREFLAGESVAFGTPNNAALRKAVLEHQQKGMEVLEEFYSWLVRVRGMEESTAKRHTGRVWDAFCFTYDEDAEESHPWEILDRHEDYSYSMRKAYLTALRYFAAYSSDSKLVMELTARSPRSKHRSRVLSPQKPHSGPYSEEDTQALLKATKEFKGDPRFPWAYSLMRIILLTGVSVANLLYVSRDRLEKGKASGVLETWSRTRKAQRIPFKLIAEEVELLLSFPWRWTDFADLVAPAVAPGKRISVAKRRISTRIKEIYERAELPYHKAWSAQLRLTAAVRYYEKTDNIVGAGQILVVKDLNAVRKKLDLQVD